PPYTLVVSASADSCWPLWFATRHAMSRYVRFSSPSPSGSGTYSMLVRNVGVYSYGPVFHVSPNRSRWCCRVIAVSEGVRPDWLPLPLRSVEQPASVMAHTATSTVERVERMVRVPPVRGVPPGPVPTGPWLRG